MVHRIMVASTYWLNFFWLSLLQGPFLASVDFKDLSDALIGSTLPRKNLYADFPLLKSSVTPAWPLSCNLSIQLAKSPLGLTGGCMGLAISLISLSLSLSGVITVLQRRNAERSSFACKFDLAFKQIERGEI